MGDEKTNIAEYPGTLGHIHNTSSSANERVSFP